MVGRAGSRRQEGQEAVQAQEVVLLERSFVPFEVLEDFLRSWSLFPEAAESNWTF